MTAHQDICDACDACNRTGTTPGGWIPITNGCPGCPNCRPLGHSARYACAHIAPEEIARLRAMYPPCGGAREQTMSKFRTWGAKGGRPKLPPEERRDAQIKLGLTQEEFELVVTAAAVSPAGLAPSVWARATVVAEAHRLLVNEEREAAREAAP